MRIGLVVSLVFGIYASVGAQEFTTYKTTTGKAKKAYEAAGMALDRQDYATAVEQLTKAIKADDRFYDAYQDRASAHYFLTDYEGAITDYQRAIELMPDGDPRLYFYLGETQYKADRYAEALVQLDEYIDRAEGRRGRLLDKARRLRAATVFAAEAIKNPVPYTPEKLSEAINRPDRAEYLPVVSVDGEQLIFTAVVRNDENFYISQRDAETGEWLPAQELAGVNTPQNEGAETISADGRTIVFTACNRPDGKGSCDLYYSEQRDGRWTPPANIGSPINTKDWESLPALSPDGNTLYFSSNRAGGLGGKDIYVSRREAGGGWSAPENVGEPVNTSADDQSPFLHPDGRSLYFMSQGHPGMGGYDLFVSRADTDGQWQTPENLGYPINTKNDEGALFITLDGRTAYMATDREYATGGASSFSNPRGGGPTDIYRFELPPSARPLPVTYVKARVYDAVTKAPLTASVDFENLTRGGNSRTATRPDGTFLLTLPLDSDYALSIEKAGYFFHSENFALSVEGADSGQPYRLEIGLRPLPPTQPVANIPAPSAAEPIILRNVLFETGSAALKPVSRTELNRLRDLLNSRPRMRIQVNGHTDNVGGEADNLQLSKDRARAVYDYLVGEGIDPDRLQSEGYGETRPIATNDTAEGRRQNRRTAFVVL